MTPLRQALPADMAAIEALLSEVQLPLDGLRDPWVTLVVAGFDAGLAGVAGFERHGVAGLLRSVAVRPSARGQGVAASLVRAVEHLARSRGISRLGLLTTTAAPWFVRQGYRLADRSAAPATLMSSAQFNGVCPASAAYLEKVFDASSD